MLDVLDGIDDEIDEVSTEGTYDHQHCYEEIADCDAEAVIPLAKMSRFGNMEI